MSDTLHTRPAVAADGPRLYRLDHDSWSSVSEVSARSAPPGPDSTLFDERHRPQDYLVAELDGEIVGYIRHAVHVPLPHNEIFIVFRNNQFFKKVSLKYIYFCRSSLQT